MSPLKLKNFNGFETLVSEELGVSPFFSSQIRYRVHHKLYSNIAVVGEAGIGKSYQAINLARVCEGLMRDGRDRFSVDQIVFRQSEYLDLLPKLRMGKAIVFDEPSYAMGKRDWYKELQKVLVHTLESQRFLVHPLWIPIINLNLLDKTIRAYLISHVVNVIGRGRAIAYRIKPSQRTDKIYWYQMGELHYRMFDSEECVKDSCLGCKKLDSCSVFRAQYERKKRETQYERYQQAKEQAAKKETQDLTERQIEQLMIPELKKHLNDFLSDRTGKLSVGKMRVFLRDEHEIHLSAWKTRQLKESLEALHPDLFDEE